VSEPFLGEIRMFGFNFAPQGWAMCNGQLLPISQNQALFALLGTQYGGDGVQTFALPDLRSRVAIHQGQGNGLSNYVIGQAGGVEATTMTQGQMPAHSHLVQATNHAGKAEKPTGMVLAHPAVAIYGGAPDGTTMDPAMITNTGGNQPVSDIQPYLVLNFCIALQGIFPSRN
jgi:microcystin-dependent protein